MITDFGPQLGETFLRARHDFKIDFMQSCKFDLKIDFLQHWANHGLEGARAITIVPSRESYQPIIVSHSIDK